MGDFDCAGDLLPSSRTNLKLARSVNQENEGHEEEQVHGGADIGFIRQAEAGMPVKALCRKGGFSDATFYKWRAKYGGMDVPDAKRLRELESENAELKKLLAGPTWTSVIAARLACGANALPRRRP